MPPMTEQQKKFRIAAIAENYVARYFKGKRLSHKHEFDVETDKLLIEVKAITRKQQDSFFKIHIAGISKDIKDDYAIQTGKLALLVVCRLYRNRVVEMRFGIIKCHCRYSSLYPITDLEWTLKGMDYLN